LPCFPDIPDPPALGGEDWQWLGSAVWRALFQRLTSDPAFELGPPPPGALQPAGVFVTLVHHGDLRGCLGASVPGQEPLAEVAPRLAVASATKDRRFGPLRPEELPGLTVEITVLGDLVRLPSASDAILEGLQPVRHGVQVRRASRTGLLLPQVARRHEWSAVELLGQVCRKAGLEADAWRCSDTEIWAFQAVTFSAARTGGRPP